MTQGSALEALLKRDRAVVLAGLLDDQVRCGDRCLPQGCIEDRISVALSGRSKLELETARAIRGRRAPEGAA